MVECYDRFVVMVSFSFSTFSFLFFCLPSDTREFPFQFRAYSESSFTIEHVLFEQTYLTRADIFNVA